MNYLFVLGRTKQKTRKRLKKLFTMYFLELANRESPGTAQRWSTERKYKERKKYLKKYPFFQYSSILLR